MIIVVWLSATNMSSYLMWFLLLPCFFFQLCSLVSLQRYTKALSTLQRASLVEKSRQKPQERMKVLSEVGVFAEIVMDFVLTAIFPSYILVLVFCCRLWNVTIMILNLCYVHVAFQSAPASLKLMAVFCQPQGYSLLCHNEVGSWLCK